MKNSKKVIKFNQHKSTGYKQHINNNMWINPQYVDNHVDNYANTGVQLLITHEGFIFLMIISMVLRIESFLTTS